MGLIKAGMGALGGTLADQWKEFFYCEAMDKDVMSQRERNARVPVLPTRKETITSFPTAA